MSQEKEGGGEIPRQYKEHKSNGRQFYSKAKDRSMPRGISQLQCPFSPAEARPNETTVCIKGRQRPGH